MYGRHEDNSSSDGHKPERPIPPPTSDDGGSGGGRHERDDE
ncbi:hypothetical protein B005_1162 [Nocardiopsis alba ATCC BAA-2165]|uniref:Uncharacterized protein n=1 Tax=Nocardiopsis alba (strain ATCC BAA-2165 / BE74) TaxID=1205910 RepID=J7L9F0_NOCAA|nr:hypothetical protein B005_1162 [Nocardiopsis alba ATCC BAA-2165]